MRRIYFFLFAICVILLGSSVGFAQGPATGIYQFGSFDQQVFDTINRGNLNVHLSIPIASKSGRGGANFIYALNYDSSIWLPTAVTGSNVWVPQSGFGWRINTTAAYGYVTYIELLSKKCTLPGGGQSYIAMFYGYKYHDMQGVAHSFPMSYTSPCGGGFPTGTGTYATTDNSGYVIYEDNGGATVTSPNGLIYEVPSGEMPFGGGDAVNVVDTNGNEISVSSSGVFTDTTGKTVLLIRPISVTPMRHS